MSALVRAMNPIGWLSRRSKMPVQPRMYVLVRRDLSDNYRMVQGKHALAQYALDEPVLFKVWNNGTIAVLGVRNLIEMKMWEQKLLAMEKRFSAFREPDLDGQLTSLACFDVGDIFASLRPA